MKQVNDQLIQFISKARAAGKGDAEVRSMLLDSGWDPGLVTAALMPTGDLVPPPPPAPKSSGREIFFYLLQFICLGIGATSLGSIIFAALDRYLPTDITAGYYASTSAIPWPLASLIVVAPIFAGVTWVLVRDVSTGRTSAMSKIRRLLIYLALFLASATVIGDVIALVYRFLAGQVNTRFVLKVLTILLIGGWVIWYYFITVKRDEHKAPYPKAWHKTHGLVFAVVVLGAVVLGFILNGTPFDQQKIVRDQQRINDLQTISYSVQNYYQTKQALPASLVELYTGYQPQVPSDVSTRQPYEYLPGKAGAYQLCATFELASADQSGVSMPQPVYGPGQTNWTHPAGHYCFSLEVAVPLK